VLVEIHEDTNSLTVLRDILKEEYSFRDIERSRFFNGEGNEITDETLLLTKNNDIIYIEQSQNKPFDYANILKQYKVLEKLGQGGFGKVYKAQHIATKQLVAIKYIDITQYST
jgi:serine/threonine protein kinase